MLGYLVIQTFTIYYAQYTQTDTYIQADKTDTHIQKQSKTVTAAKQSCLPSKAVLGMYLRTTYCSWYLLPQLTPGTV